MLLQVNHEGHELQQGFYDCSIRRGNLIRGLIYFDHKVAKNRDYYEPRADAVHRMYHVLLVLYNKNYNIYDAWGGRGLTFPSEHHDWLLRVLHHVESFEECHQFVLVGDQEVLVEVRDGKRWGGLSLHWAILVWKVLEGLEGRVVWEGLWVEDQEGRVVLRVIVLSEELAVFYLVLILV